ncbi:MAG TPA: SMI1/KNR4 family protein [Longimicrobium sp.]|nr:SMI1/KNR4 family protein [Longimicrobium sp.]
MNDVARRLVARWAEQGIAAVGGGAEDRIAGFEARLGARLPADLRAYFLVVGGMSMEGERAMDGDLIRFWPINEVATLASSWVPAPDADRWLVVADYAMWTWAYAVRLPDGVVALSHGGSELVPLASSFDEFLESYLRRDDSVIAPA